MKILVRALSYKCWTTFPCTCVIVGPPRTSIEETITPKEQAKDISIIIIPEQTFEGDEVFQLRLSDAVGGLPFSRTVELTTVTIIDSKFVSYHTTKGVNISDYNSQTDSFT